MTNIRRGTPEDLLCIVEFQILLAAESEGVSLCRPTVESGVRQALSGQAGACYWLIETDIGEIQGVCMTVPEWSDWRNAFFWWIQSVYVIPKFRRRGVYKSMHLYVATEAHRHKNVGGLRLYVDKDNTVAQRVYSSLHMSPTHYDMYEIEFATRPDR